MTILPLTEVKAKLNELIDSATNTHQRVTITKHGKPAAVLISVDDLEALEETVYWQAQPGVQEDVAQAHAEARAGALMSEAAVRGRYGVGHV